MTAYRLRLPRQRGDRRGRYLFQYAAFGLAAAVLASLLHLRRRWEVVQVNSMPDVLVFAAAVPRLLGARVLLDLHECMPEFFSVKYGLGPGHPAVRMVAAGEQASIRFADRVITCTDQMRDAFVARGAAPWKIDVVLNAADETVFDVRRHPPAFRRPDRFTLICHGAIEQSYGLDTLVHAAALVRDRIPGLRVEIYGEGTYRAELRRLARDLALDGVYHDHGVVPIEELLGAIAAADVGVVAMRRNAFRDLTHCNKMFDFIAMRRPVIVSRTRSVQAYFDASSLAFFESGNEHDLARVILALHADPQLGEGLVERAAEVSAPYSWTHQRRLYRAAVDRLLTPEPQPMEEAWPVGA